MPNKILLIIIMLTPIPGFTLSCPNNGSILETGYTLEQVIQRCGEPMGNDSSTNTINLAEEWVYYHSEVNRTNTVVTIYFNNGHVSNINIVTNPGYNPACQNSIKRNPACYQQVQNVTYTGLLGRAVQKGDSVNYVRSVCGTPARLNVTSSNTIKADELIYSGQEPNRLVFKDGKLVGWKF